MAKRKFRVGQTVVLPSGKKGKVVGSAFYAYGKPYQWAEYRIRPAGSRRTIYRRESELRPARKRSMTRRLLKGY